LPERIVMPAAFTGRRPLCHRRMAAILAIPMADRHEPSCHCEEWQRRSNPQKLDQQDCRVAIVPRNDNKGFVRSCQAQ
jgi:hypothetical protein